MFSILYKGNLL